ncbi:hypothetical protein SCLCIDRAFT_1216384, partial [Scleroderma citrinum Foug A]
MQACCHQDEVRVISNSIDEQFYSVNMQWFCIGNESQRLSIFPTPPDSMVPSQCRTAFKGKCGP